MSDQAAYDVESILLRLKELVEAGRSMPMSASVLVNREEFLELLEESIATLPQELRHSRWLLKEREEFLSQARREADDIIEAGRVRAERMVERTEVVREARRVAQSVVDDAEASEGSARSGGLNYPATGEKGKHECGYDKAIHLISYPHHRLTAMMP